MDMPDNKVMPEMELDNLVQLSIKTFDNTSPGINITVRCQNDGILCCDILRKVSEALGLKKESLQYFILCQGLEAPIRCFKKGEVILKEHDVLSLQKWCFDIKVEKELMHKDPVATNLIFFQALHDVHTGKLKPNKERAERLADCLDPDFPADGQYITLCQSLPLYTSVLISGCDLVESPLTMQALFSHPSKVDVVLSVYGSQFSVDSNVCKFTWCDLMKWQIHNGNKVIVFTFKGQNSHVFSVALQTEQIQFLFSSFLEMLRIFQICDKDSDMTFHTEMIETKADGSVEWTNGLFDPSKSVIYIDKL